MTLTLKTSPEKFKPDRVAGHNVGRGGGWFYERGLAAPDTPRGGRQLEKRNLNEEGKIKAQATRRSHSVRRKTGGVASRGRATGGRDQGTSQGKPCVFAGR